MKRLAFLLLPLAALTQPGPKFEVASVKLHELPTGAIAFRAGGAAINLSGNRVTVGGTLTSIVMAAYNLKDFQVSGGPEWADGGGRPEIYDIVAKTEGDTTPSMDQVRLALQELLADRFHLKVHHDSKEVTVYDVVVDKNGPKMKEGTPGTDCKRDMLAAGVTMRVKFTGCTVAEFLKTISITFDHPLMDRTGLKSGYDFTLEFSPRRPDGSLVPGQDSPDVVETAPTIMPALQQELGLKVVPAKESVDVVVIDHADRPGENR
jgi:uncharacterized protein (TIGR03435 family)